MFNTGHFANSSEHHKCVDGVLKEELGRRGPWFLRSLLRRSHRPRPSSLGRVRQVQRRGYSTVWRGDLGIAEKHQPASGPLQRPLAQPHQPVQGSTADRKLDTGFVDDPSAGVDSRCCRSQILIPGELKSNLSTDKVSKAWLDLGRYTREMLAAQDTRRFVLGFTLCDRSYDSGNSTD